MGRTALMYAAESGHTSSVKLLLESGAQVDKEDSRKDTAVTLAAFKGHEDTVELLIENGATTDDQNKYDYTALMAAVKGGSNTVFDMLLSKGLNASAEFDGNYYSADPYAYYSHDLGNRKTAVVYAAMYGRKEILEKLWGRGISFEQRTFGGYTPLMLAAKHGHYTTVELLIGKGASLDTSNDKGMTALMLASRHSAIVKLLVLEGSSVFVKDDKGKTALMHVAANGENSTIQMLVANGARIEARSNDGLTPIMWAARAANSETFNCLAGLGASLEAKSEMKKTLLMIAVVGGSLDIINYLLEHGADTSIKNRIGKTAADYTADEELKQLFVDWAAATPTVSPTAPTDTYTCDTVLFGAIYQSSLANVKSAVENGASLESRCTRTRRNMGVGLKDMTALIIAAREGSTHVAELLASRGASLDLKRAEGPTAIEEAATYHNWEIVEMLARQGADLNTEDYYSQINLLTLAINEGKSDVAKVLLESGFDVGTRTENGEVAHQHYDFHFYFDELHSKETLEMFIEHGGNLNNRDDEGNTFLFEDMWGYLCSGSSSGVKEIEYLFSIGLDFDIQNYKGETVLHQHSYKLPVIGIDRRFYYYHGDDMDDCILSVYDFIAGKIKNIDVKDDNGVTPLLKAVLKGYRIPLRLAEIYLKHGASPDAKDENGIAPLMAAARIGLLSHARLLIENGAHVNARDRRHGYSALYFASKEGHIDIVQLLVNNGAIVDDMAIKAARNSDVEQALLAGPQPTLSPTGYPSITPTSEPTHAPTDENDCSLDFINAIENESFKEAQLLIGSGEKVNCMDQAQSALMIAARKGSFSIVELLVNNGANINVASVKVRVSCIAASIIVKYANSY